MVFGRAFWVLLPWQAPRARPGAFGTDLKAARQARTGDDGLGRRGNATHPSRVDSSHDPSVLQDTNNILVERSPASPAAALRARVVADAFLVAEGRRSRLRSATPRFAAKRYLLLKHCAALVTALQEYSVRARRTHSRRSKTQRYS